MNQITETRTTRRAAATRSAIIEAAEQLLTEGGPDAVTIEAIAERADVAVQTVYNRVGRRPEILLAVAERALVENRQYMDAAFAETGPPLVRMTRAARAYTQFAIERPQQFRLILDPPDEPEALERISGLIDHQVGKLAEVLADGVADGSFTASIEPDTLAVAMWAMMDGILALNWRADRKRVDAAALAQMVESAMSVIQNGILSH
ncbi:TetR/AcrR family transcriptional regulator [Rhodococcus maanshanensis]|uniref:TetR/AcrR family transcriptional regulator n=1 Tax=Rhodococcus maanshanensis TaxID=183556 RepID=UPI0022B3ACB9|nr:TetR/AcrR family transcriptional regulator [Rhodococcus maanshanensis]MCZ4556742.1 TetR/AcrR family transcriptional regulator [Rhodococcus maanshanensis]